MDAVDREENRQHGDHQTDQLKETKGQRKRCLFFAFREAAFGPLFLALGHKLGHKSKRGRFSAKEKDAENRVFIDFLRLCPKGFEPPTHGLEGQNK